MKSTSRFTQLPCFLRTRNSNNFQQLYTNIFCLPILSLTIRNKCISSITRFTFNRLLLACDIIVVFSHFIGPTNLQESFSFLKIRIPGGSLHLPAMRSGLHDDVQPKETREMGMWRKKTVHVSLL